MKVLFLPDAGFDKIGGFVELENDDVQSNRSEVFERDSYLNVYFDCQNIDLRLSASPSDNPTETDQAKGLQRHIVCIGVIEKNRYGQFRFALLGGTKEHDRVILSIFPSDGYGLRAWGSEAEDNIDRRSEEAFYVDILVPQRDFEEVCETLRQPGSTMKARAAIGKLAGFYVHWSPVTDEGRVIKYLGKRKMVENHSEIPNDFLKPFLGKYESTGIAQGSIYLVVPISIREETTVAATDNNDEDAHKTSMSGQVYSARIEAKRLKSAERQNAALWVIAAAITIGLFL